MIHVKQFLVSLFCLGLTSYSLASISSTENSAKESSAKESADTKSITTDDFPAKEKPLLDQIRLQLKTAIRLQARRDFSPNLRDEAIRVQSASLNNRLRLHPCHQPIHVKILSKQLQSRTTAKVNCGKQWSLMVSAQVEVHMPAVLTSRPIAKGQMIQSEDLNTQERNILSTSGHYFSDEQQVIGFEARRSIRAGTLLRKQLLRAARVVKKGDYILLTAGSGDLRVSIQAEALSDGRIGDSIRVRNRRTRKVVKAKITATGNAEIIW